MFPEENHNKMPLPPRPFKILIVGCGIGGLTAALGLKQCGHDVTIFEQATELSEVGAGIQLPPNASRILQRFEVLEEVMSKANVLERNSLRRYQNDEELGEAPLMPQAEKKYRAPLAVIHRGDLFDILAKRVREIGVDIRLNACVLTVDSSFEARIQLHTHEWVVGDVVIASDGIKSRVREQIMAHQRVRSGCIPTGDAAYRVLIPREIMRRDPTTAELIDQNVGMRWMGPGGHIMAYPIRRNTLYNVILLHPQTDSLDEEESWTQPGDKQDMQSMYRNWNPVVQTLLHQVSEENILEWSLWTHPPLPTWFQNRCVLMGDACHPMLPYVAQGAAQAMEDAAVLAMCLSLTGDIQTAFKAYELHRKDRAERIQNSAMATRKVLHLPDGEDQGRRDEAFRERGHSPDLWADAKWQDYMWGEINIPFVPRIPELIRPGTDVMKDVLDSWEDTEVQVQRDHRESVL